MKTKLALVLCLLAPVVSQATVEGKYNVNVQVYSASGPSSEVLTYLNGYDCSSQTSLEFSEVMKDQNGNARRISQSGKSSYNFSTLFSGGRDGVNMNLTRNMYNTSPELKVNVHETCTKSYLCEDSEGETTWCSDSKYFDWNCRFNQNSFPSQIGENHTVVCDPPTSSFGSSYDYFEELMMGFVRQKQISVDLSLISRQEIFAYNACADGSQMHTLHLEQGLSQNIGEDDFQLFITINGIDYKLLSHSGLYADDIKVCSASGVLNFKVRGVEDDVWMDDNFTSTEANYSLQLSHGQQREITLTRKGWFGTRTSHVKAMILE